jgi:hypothetical protein
VRVTVTGWVGRGSGLFCALALLLVTSAGAASTKGPDLIVVSSDYIQQSIYQETRTFDPADCAVQEGAITAGTHKLLRFHTQTANIGSSDLRVGKPRANSSDWEFFACHGHWHFVRYAEYALTDQAGATVAVGHKQSFCIVDTDPYLPDAGPAFFDSCDRQGLSAGWSDVYCSCLDGQWVVVDDVVPGTYWLNMTVNYASALRETDYGNNTSSFPVAIS